MTSLQASEELRANGATTEEIIRYLRDSGLSILESIPVLSKLKDLSLADAKKTVHYSETWADLRSEHDSFHRSIKDVVDTLADKTKS